MNANQLSKNSNVPAPLVFEGVPFKLSDCDGLAYRPIVASSYNYASTITQQYLPHEKDKFF